MEPRHRWPNTLKRRARSGRACEGERAREHSPAPNAPSLSCDRPCCFPFSMGHTTSKKKQGVAGGRAGGYLAVRGA